jgi:hypothetical protein
MLFTHDWVGGQTTPHIPQLFGSCVVSAQPLGQQVSLPLQAGPPLQGVSHMLF